MNLKGIMQTLGAKPGQVMSDPYARAWAPTPSPIKEAEGEDHEVSMAQNSLDTIIKMATELKAKMGENEKDIPAWIQDHITNSENFISQASSNYHEYSTNEAGINGAPRFPSLDGVANESIREEVKDWDTIHNVFVKFLKANTKELEKRVLSKDEDATKKAIKSIVSGLTNAQRSLKMEAVDIPVTALPSTVKSKLMLAIDTIKDAELTYNQKVQVVKQVTDSLGIDKTEFNKIASRLKGTMESVNEAESDDVNWEVIENVFVNFLLKNTRELQRRVKAKHLDSTKSGIKSIISGLVNAQRSLKMESVNEASYTVKADNAYQFINGAVAVLGMYSKDEKIESGVKSTLQRVVKDLEGLRKYFFSRKDESVNEGKTYSNKFAAWFTGTVLNTVKHPTYGTHQLTADQIQKSSGDYKTKLFKAIEVAVKNGDITPDVIRKNESLRLKNLK